LGGNRPASLCPICGARRRRTMPHRQGVVRTCSDGVAFRAYRQRCRRATAGSKSSPRRLSAAVGCGGGAQCPTRQRQGVLRQGSDGVALRADQQRCRRATAGRQRARVAAQPRCPGFKRGAGNGSRASAVARRELQRGIMVAEAVVEFESVALGRGYKPGLTRRSSGSRLRRQQIEGLATSGCFGGGSCSVASNRRPP
jgi:hypothetical protein